VARNSYDAHRPLCDNLDEILTVQDQRRVSENLTLHHNRTLYVIEDTEQNRRLRGHQVTVHEHENGRILIRHAGRELPHRAQPKETARITQGATVENKRLGAALQQIAVQQRQRDIERLANRNVTLRAKKRIREAAGLSA